jgi:glutamate-1-semialdehyde 2,1-aminomutase
MNNQYWAYILLAIILLFTLDKIRVRLRLSFAKHPSLRGHAKMSRRMAKLLWYFEYDDISFFKSDQAPQEVAEKRKKGLDALNQYMAEKMAKTISFSQTLETSISDVNFTSAYKVPFPYRQFLSKELKLSSIGEQTLGVKIKDMDQNWAYDLSGSYGVNVFGYDFYKKCIDKGIDKVKELGPVLGSYHPIIKENVEMLKGISGMEEVSFHMSGTEAVMQAVRLARYHTNRSHLVRLCGSYHGWWDGVQPGVGNQRKSHDVYTLSDLSDATLKVLNTRKDIACLLINPMQAFHPNSDAPGDATLISSERSSQYCFDEYKAWLQKLREVCTQRNIVLIFDEVFTGFRLAYGGAQEFFGIQADMVTYGKTLGGGLPIGVVCGSHVLMKRYKDNAPANISFARGTFNSHPYVLGAMNEFLTQIASDDIQEIYKASNQVWESRVTRLNRRLQYEQLPIHIAHLHSVLSVQYKMPSRYNWMLQFYLRREGLELSWTGTGRLIMSLAYSEEEFSDVIDRFIRAAHRMKSDGWWWQHPLLTNKAIKRLMLIDMLKARFPILKKLHRPPDLNLAFNDTQRGTQL